MLDHTGGEGPGVPSIDGSALPNGFNKADDVHPNHWYNQDFGGYCVSEQPIFTKRAIRVVCVGAGSAGLQIAYKAERLLENVSLQIYERNEDVGGCWLTNKYPGVACDIPIHSYQFHWARDPSWSQYYASGKDIWRYLKDVATKYDLERHIKFSHCVQSADWDEERGVWTLSIQTPDESVVHDECEILVNGTGMFHTAKWPSVPGIESFKGKLMHSSSWDAGSDLSGKTVAVIGSGPSAIQIIPSLQPGVKRLISFIRSPTWISAGFAAKYASAEGGNFQYSKEQLKSFQDDPQAYAKYCRSLDDELNNRFRLYHAGSKEQKAACNATLHATSQRLKHNKELVEHFTPDYGIGCRRPTPGPGYLESLLGENVEVVKSGLARFTETGVVDESGKECPVDAVICSTGFDTSFAPPFECRGRNGVSLRDKFGDFPRGYLSIMVDEFPNMFLFLGPNAPLVHSSQISVLEWHTRYLFKVIDKIQRESIKSLSPKRECVEDFTQHAHVLMKRLSWSFPCRSWFKLGKTHGPVTALWPGSRLHYCRAMEEPRYEDFEIEYRSRNRYQYMGNGFDDDEMRPDGNMSWYLDDSFCQA